MQTSISGVLPTKLPKFHRNFARSYARGRPLTFISCHSLEGLHGLHTPSSQALTFFSSNSTSKRTSVLGGSYVHCPVQKRNEVGKSFCAVGLGIFGENVVEHQSHLHTTEDKVGVLILNLGGPEMLHDVLPFLFNLLQIQYDIIRLPRLFRFLQIPFAKLISVLRAPKTIEQVDALKMSLKAKNMNANVYVGMRYWYPFIEEAVQQIKRDKLQGLLCCHSILNSPYLLLGQASVFFRVYLGKMNIY
ncbi:hypothetical protein QYF36_006838 [Acer negundo]|nr:hypothetical protein QYF36_006838 [Acer negundo]